ncbi:Flagellar motor rotation protein MotB [Rhodovulum sp. P5]|uniref:type IVB secretion system protein IcmH/DotU n=1 Tax=Rhodovulum sp. P5 TaxID=1564506 RepID=UPI0009C2194C|nr:type IVB secretion system protein IcmH/DotU [Rhodovulum sp. P5]ARE41192.1 Flagellar motor rotation protein MotB [Rhodovulum sp. P5]
MARDDDKTVIRHPRAPRPQGAEGTGGPFARRDPGDAAADRTVIGMPIMPDHVPSAPPSQGEERQTPARLQRPPHLQGAAPAPPRGPVARPTPTGRPGAVPRPPAQRPDFDGRGDQQIAVEDAMRATGLGPAGPSNPLLAAAVSLLSLLGRLRTGRVELRSTRLEGHLALEIDRFEQVAAGAGLSADEVNEAKYILAACVDDILQNLPVPDPSRWRNGGMGMRYFGDPDAPLGAFRCLDAALRDPARRTRFIELMLACLSLGLEGPYRNLPGGQVQLAHIRHELRELLGRLAPRDDGHLSPRWRPVIPGGPRRLGVPVWAAAGIGALMVLSLFSTLATMLSDRAGAAEGRIATMHQGLPPVVLARTTPVQRAPEPAPTTQMERLQEGVAGLDIAVSLRNDWVLLRPAAGFSFVSGSADLEGEAGPLVDALARVLNAETGAIRVVGHSDSQPLSGTGPFRTNQQLSEARAQTVADLLAARLADPGRIVAEGKGPVEPIADNATPEGRALNRRVEILIRRGD